ncbi:thioesterase II family protein [Streptomyces coeruleorubidus]|uniref:thioesterase II family protein n=1 Tax=Streptomyces coeruleorubidus TaxID=116188 RepID=UPI0037A32459
MSSGPFIRPRRVESPAVRCVVVPHAGGSGSAYYPLTRELPDGWDLLLLDLPGRGKRSSMPALEDMASLVDLVTDDVAACAGDAPLALFGHSLGGAVAFEAARALQRRGRAPVWTGVSGLVAPDRGPVPRDLDAELADEELMARVAAVGALPERANELPAFREQFLGLLRSDLRALAGYRPAAGRTPLSGPLTVFGGTDDVLAPPHTLSAWARETHGPHHVRLYPGGHFHFFGSRFPAFARAIVREIQGALREPATPVWERDREAG